MEILLHLMDNIAAKHKFSLHSLNPGDNIYMYGVLVGKANETIPQGAPITIKNIHHATDEFKLGERKSNWKQTGCFKVEKQNLHGLSPA